MAQNFKAYACQKGFSLHVKLSGDFDGSSALQVIRILNDKHQDITDIVINTNGLRHVHPFGKAVFLKSLNGLTKKSHKIHFVGSHAAKISHEDYFIIHQEPGRS